MTALGRGYVFPAPHPIEVNIRQLPVNSAQHMPADAILIFSLYLGGPSYLGSNAK
jgi:hypothetical protein